MWRTLPLFDNAERRCQSIVKCFSVSLDVFLKLWSFQKTVSQLFVERYCVQKMNLKQIPASQVLLALGSKTLGFSGVMKLFGYFGENQVYF